MHEWHWPKQKELSPSQESDRVAFFEVVLPYVRKELRPSAMDELNNCWWSTKRALVPLLRVLSGEREPIESVAQGLERCKELSGGLEGNDLAEWIIHQAAIRSHYRFKCMITEPIKVTGMVKEDAVALMMTKEKFNSIKALVGERVEFSLSPA